ncbi:hypothetical protein ABT332_22980 [Saccharomonospora azurea]|uniref:hypothetical protein n=1 Tax=Saccharomonospora azurea TaxID=40988 RepID=UPI003320FF3D
MSSQAERLKAKAARIKAKAKTDDRTAEDRERALASAPATPHAKPIRSTVDLPPVRHAALKSWCGETAVELGRSRVTTQDVVRALIARLLTDETLARKIRADLRKDNQ